MSVSRTFTGFRRFGDAAQDAIMDRLYDLDNRKVKFIECYDNLGSGKPNGRQGEGVLSITDDGSGDAQNRENISFGLKILGTPKGELSPSVRTARPLFAAGRRGKGGVEMSAGFEFAKKHEITICGRAYPCDISDKRMLEGVTRDFPRVLQAAQAFCAMDAKLKPDGQDGRSADTMAQEALEKIFGRRSHVPRLHRRHAGR